MYEPALVTLAAVVLGAVARRRSARADTVKAAFLALTLVDRFSFGSGYNTSVPPSELLPAPPLLATVRRDPQQFRVAILADAGTPDEQMTDSA
jgi:hypothetical protein